MTHFDRRTLMLLLVLISACTVPESGTTSDSNQANQSLEETSQSSAPSQGELRNMMGILFQGIPSGKYGGPGALVTGIDECGPAQAAGIQLGDVLTAIGNQAVDDKNLRTLLDGLPLHENITIGFTRQGQGFQTTLTLASSSTKARARAVPFSGIGSWTDAMAVICLYSGSPAAVAGIKPSDTIVSIGGQAVNVANYQDVLASFAVGSLAPFVVTREGSSLQYDVPLVAGSDPYNKVEVGDVITSENQTVEKIIDTERIEIENCFGTGQRIARRTIEKKETRRLDFDAEGELKLYGLVPFFLAEPRIAAKFNYDNESELSEKKEEEMSAAAGTVAVYRIVWYEESSTGQVEVLVNNEKHLVPFSVTRRLRAEVESQPAASCEGRHS